MSLDHVIGQSSAVRQLKVAIEAYRNNGTGSYPHTLFSGPSGVGKTTFSEILAKEIERPLTVELAQNLAKPAAAMGLLLTLEENHILFIDEIHELPATVGVTLYRALEEQKLFIGKNRVVQLPPFTLIGATTHEYLLERSMRQRFSMVLRLSHYSVPEINLLIQQRGERNGWEIASEAALFMAKLSRGTPRLAVRHLEATRRCALAAKQPLISLETAQMMLEIESLDSLGLDQIERQYLRILGGTKEPVRLNILASQMGIPRQSIEMLESDLIRLGLVEKNEKGRLLTVLGIDHLSIAN